MLNLRIKCFFMYGLPQSTIVKKQLPKKAIFAKFDLKPSQREGFDADIARIDIVAVVNPTTVPAVGKGAEVEEFGVLTVQLKRMCYDNKNIAMLTKLLPQKMVFALHYEDKMQFAIYHTKLICSDWKMADDAVLTLSSLNLDVVWENIVKSIGNIMVEDGNTLKEQIKADDERAKILKQIEILDKKCRTEKQARRKLEIFEQIKKLKSQI